MHSKLLFLDTETTGLDPVVNDVIQFACIIEIDGEVKEEFVIAMQPHNWSTVDQKAMDIHGITLDDLKHAPSCHGAYVSIVGMFSRYIDKYNSRDKFLPVAYNGDFDMRFMREFFRKNNDVYFGSWVTSLIDPLPLFRFLSYRDIINVSDHKLSTIAGAFGIDIQAHDALSDCRALRKLFQVLCSLKIEFPAKEQVNESQCISQA